MRRHPWIFSGAVRKIVGEPQEGDLVDVVAADGRWLAVGHYQSDSIICKVLSFDTQQVDETFFRERLQSAIAYRERLGFFGSKKEELGVLDNSQFSIYQRLPLGPCRGRLSARVGVRLVQRGPGDAGTLGGYA